MTYTPLGKGIPFPSRLKDWLSAFLVKKKKHRISNLSISPILGFSLEDSQGHEWQFAKGRLCVLADRLAWEPEKKRLLGKLQQPHLRSP